MSNEKKIIDRIVADANKEVEAQVAECKKEIDVIVKDAEEKASREKSELIKVAESKALHVYEKEISAAEMSARKMILGAKKQCIDSVLDKAKEKITSLSQDEYIKTVEGLLKNFDNSLAKEVMVSGKDKDVLKDVIEKNGFSLSNESADINFGFIIKKDDVLYNYSFESIIELEREDLLIIASEVLFN